MSLGLAIPERFFATEIRAFLVLRLRHISHQTAFSAFLLAQNHF